MSTIDHERDRGTANGAQQATTLPPALLLILAIATGALVANLYYAQPLIAQIGPDIGIRPDLAGAIVSVTQVGYGVGLFLLVSLADLVENRRLVLIAMTCTTLALVAAASASANWVFFLASFAIGVSSTGAQVLVPFAAHLVPEEIRGRTVGNIMAGLLTGILIARPASLFIAAYLGWRSVFWLSAGLMLVIGLLIARMMPRYHPNSGLTYPRILRSMISLVGDIPALRQRAAYQTLIFASFNIFWTAVPLMLAEHFGLSQEGIALFALAGAGGALAAPLAGRLGDRGLIRATTLGSMATLSLGFFLTGWAAAAGALIALAVLAVVIDAAVQGNQIISQRVIFTQAAAIRGRINALYMTSVFFGGAAGSLIATASYHWGGWTATAITGGMFGVAALLLFAIDQRRT